ncbi:polysaccharide pyruvyl transferase family protein [Umezakia ovalisporum]|uniref:polysaccharide pyruvyl transferase family protein n=1 Tax=Umezakia ovalisporum TaxID=75695 RepID=UPI0035B71D0D
MDKIGNISNLKSLKIAITGSFGFKDIGDEAMLTEDLSFILNDLSIPRDNIYIFGDQPDYVSYYHQHPLHRCFNSSLLQREHERLLKSKHKASVKQKIKALAKATILSQQVQHSEQKVCVGAAKSCDLLLVTGGGTINTRNREGWSIKRMHALVSYFKHLGKPVFMSGQTIGPLGLYQEHDNLAREIINSVEFLSVRDSNYSRRYLKLIDTQPKKFVETFDDAYTLPYKDQELPPDVAEFFQRNNNEVFAVNVTEYTSDLPEQRVFIANLCEKLIETFGVNLVLVSHAEKDFYNLSIIYDMLNNSLKESVILPDTRFWRGEALKKLISSCRLAIGGRYHFIVFAGTSNTPFVGMCGNHYSYIKQDGFARVLGLEDFILTEKETWDMSIVLSKVQASFDLQLDLETKFQRPSVSMQHFGEWLQSLFENQ